MSSLPLSTLSAVQEQAAALGVPSNGASTFRELLFSHFVDRGDHSDQLRLRSFLDSSAPASDESSQPIEEFAEQDRSDWAVHCPRVDAIWRRFCDDIKSIAGDQIRIPEMAAPSGPLRSRLACLWHYPTYKSANSTWSHVMDPGSPTLSHQVQKIGYARGVSTIDLIPIRARYERGQSPDWSTCYSDWNKINQRCLTLCDEITAESRYIVAVGENALKGILDVVQRKGWSVLQLKTTFDVHVLGDRPRLLLALDGDAVARQLIVPVFHGQYALYNSCEKRGAAWDVLFNAVCELAGVEVLDQTYFLRRARSVAHANAALADISALGSSDEDPFSKLPTDLTAALKAVPSTRRANPRYVADGLAKIEDRWGTVLPRQILCLYFDELDAPEHQLDLTEHLEKGYSALSYIERLHTASRKFSQAATHAKRKAEQTDPVPAPAPKKYASESQKDWLESERAAEGRAKGNSTKRGVLVAKFTALANTHQWQTVLQQRDNPDKSAAVSTALQRIDRMQELFDDRDGVISKGLTERKKSQELSSMMTQWCVFYDENWLGGLKYLPEHGHDIFIGQNHPAVRLLEKSNWQKNKPAREALRHDPESAI